MVISDTNKMIAKVYHLLNILANRHKTTCCGCGFDLLLAQHYYNQHKYLKKKEKSK